MRPWYRLPRNRQLLSDLANERAAERLATAAGITLEEARAARSAGRRYCKVHQQWRSAQHCCRCLAEWRRRRRAKRRRLEE